MGEPFGGSSLDESLGILRHAERRRLLLNLLEAAERDEATVELEDERHGMDNVDLLAMYYAHLPKLEEFEFVEWDREAGRVRRGPRFDEVEPLLRSLPETREGLPDRLANELEGIASGGRGL